MFAWVKGRAKAGCALSTDGGAGQMLQRLILAPVSCFAAGTVAALGTFRATYRKYEVATPCFFGHVANVSAAPAGSFEGRNLAIILQRKLETG